MTKNEALMLALEALENLQRAYREAVKLWDPNHDDAYTVNSHNAIADIREALAQPEQEPVAWETFALKFANGKGLSYEKPTNLPKYLACRPLYATPPQPEQSQVEETLRYEIDALETKLAECRAQQPEPVIDKSAAVRIATALGWEPKRKPLTSKQIREWWASENGFKDCDMTKLDDFTQVVRGVEGKHGIKE